MIALTHLNKQPFAVNSDLIKFIEHSPDTVITLVTGEKFLVLESPEDVIDRIISFRRSLIEGLGVPGMSNVYTLFPGARDSERNGD